jgi:hypothetical protein
MTEWDAPEYARCRSFRRTWPRKPHGPPICRRARLASKRRDETAIMFGLGRMETWSATSPVVRFRESIYGNPAFNPGNEQFHAPLWVGTAAVNHVSHEAAVTEMNRIVLQARVQEDLFTIGQLAQLTHLGSSAQGSRPRPCAELAYL